MYCMTIVRHSILTICSEAEVVVKDTTSVIHHGSVVLAAITSCTNTSNPSVMLGAGMLAERAVKRGLSVKVGYHVSYPRPSLPNQYYSISQTSTPNTHIPQLFTISVYILVYYIMAWCGVDNFNRYPSLYPIHTRDPLAMGQNVPFARVGCCRVVPQEQWLS